MIASWLQLMVISTRHRVWLDTLLVIFRGAHPSAGVYVLAVEYINKSQFSSFSRLPPKCISSENYLVPNRPIRLMLSDQPLTHFFSRVVAFNSNQQQLTAIKERNEWGVARNDRARDCLKPNSPNTVLLGELGSGPTKKLAQAATKDIKEL